jgi:hypothetical protein
MGEIKTPLRQTVLENGDREYVITPDHSVSDVMRHLAAEVDWQEMKYLADKLALEEV